jgi:hypothetical protein
LPRVTETKMQIELVRTAQDLHPWPLEACDPLLIEAEAGYTFEKLQEQRAYNDWTPSDLIHLAQISMLMADFGAEADTLREEGYVIQSDAPKKNPRIDVLASLNSQIIARSRLIGINHAAATDKRARGNRAAMQREMRRNLT